MFGLLLRADRETAKRAIISGGHDRGGLRDKEGEIRKGSGDGSYVKSIRCPLGVEGPHHTTPRPSY